MDDLASHLPSETWDRLMASAEATENAHTLLGITSPYLLPLSYPITYVNSLTHNAITKCRTPPHSSTWCPILPKHQNHGETTQAYFNMNCAQEQLTDTVWAETLQLQAAADLLNRNIVVLDRCSTSDTVSG